MCGPALPLIAAGVMAAGQLVGGVMAMKQGAYEAKVARANSKLEGERAANEITRGMEERRSLSRKYSQIEGQQRAAMAANGIDAEFGSGADLLGDTAMLYREDMGLALDNNAAAVRGIDISASNYRQQAVAAKQRGGAAMIGAGFGAASTILGGIGDYKKAKAGAA